MVDYFNHPFAKGGRIRLVDDLNLKKSLSELSLASDFEGINLDGKKGKKNAVMREVDKQIMSAAGSDVFDFAKAKSKKDAARRRMMEELEYEETYG